MIEGSCHCGAIRIELPQPPASVINCNCSVCRRTAGLWVRYPQAEVRIHAAPDQFNEYVWGDRSMRTLRCKTCGCITHWEPFEAGADYFGINMRNFDPALVAKIPVRRFDGADTWSFIE